MAATSGSYFSPVHLIIVTVAHKCETQDIPTKAALICEQICASEVMFFNAKV